LSEIFHFSFTIFHLPFRLASLSVESDEFSQTDSSSMKNGKWKMINGKSAFLFELDFS